MQSLDHYSEAPQDTQTKSNFHLETTTRDTHLTIMSNLIGVAPLRNNEDVDAIKKERLSNLEF